MVTYDVIERLLLSRMVLSLDFYLRSYLFVLLANEKSTKEHEEYAHVQKQLMHLAIFVRVYLSSKHNVIGSSRFPDVEGVL